MLKQLMTAPLLALVLALVLALALVSAAHGADALPQVAVGRVERLANFPSQHVDPRHVDVWLPNGYSARKRYAVLYMHDGQMLYDAATTWNKQAWQVQDTLQRLIDEGRIGDTIVVGIWNNGKLRHSEYFPAKFLVGMPERQRAAHLRDSLQGQSRSDAYLRFLVEELKPAIDARYATRPEAASTFVMGSSMGGLISVYAMNEYPQVFGAAAGLSTHWSGMSRPNAAIPVAAFNYLQQQLADPATHKLYQDHGTIELDSLYGPYQLVIDDIVRERGYQDGGNFDSRVFDGAGHNEKAWAARLAVPLLFMMSKP